LLDSGRYGFRKDAMKRNKDATTRNWKENYLSLLYEENLPFYITPVLLELQALGYVTFAEIPEESTNSGLRLMSITMAGLWYLWLYNHGKIENAS